MPELPVRQRFALAIGAAVGPVDLARLGITSREELIAWARREMALLDERAWHLAQVSAVMQVAVQAQHISEVDAWHVLLFTAKLAQQSYESWEAFAASYLRGRGGPQDLDAARAVWAELPWTTELDVTIVDPAQQTRVLAASCPTCGAPRTRPSPSAYVYCDFCGALMDYDLAVAMANPVQQPGPVYVQLHRQLLPELTAARERGDRDAYRVLQRRLFGAWIVACPTAVPVRVKDVSYRDGYAAWLAEAQVAADFDDDARTREATMHAAVTQLHFISTGAGVRVPSDRFWAMGDAMFAYERRRDELCAEQGVYAMHPDGASRELQRRIGWSMFAQAWLPMLEPASADQLLARTQLAREYTLLPPAATRSTNCAHCGGPLEVVAEAKRVVCEHCGRLADVIAS